MLWPVPLHRKLHSLAVSYTDQVRDPAWLGWRHRSSESSLGLDSLVRPRHLLCQAFPGVLPLPPLSYLHFLPAPRPEPSPFSLHLVTRTRTAPCPGTHLPDSVSLNQQTNAPGAENRRLGDRNQPRGWGWAFCPHQVKTDWSLLFSMSFGDSSLNVTQRPDSPVRQPTWVLVIALKRILVPICLCP